MIKRFIEKVFGSRKRAEAAKDEAASKARASKGGARKASREQAHKRYTRDQHRIDPRDISDAAIRTCEGLHQAGYRAFVVGGAVRDLLLGRHPKDFDIATDATPEQVRGVFRRSRIIGRRFRLVHVMFGQETIEVSTFRSAHDGSNDEDNANVDEHGRLLRDNVYGSQAEDAIRRDFTMNALFYDPQSEEVWDYTDGVKDVEKKRVVMIGDPDARYREDPVRMLRAARLAGKLGFTIDAATKAPIASLTNLLDNVPEARLFDEMLKLLLSGNSLECIDMLRSLGLDTKLLPGLEPLFNAPASRAFVTLALKRTDERIRDDRGVSPAFLFAALFWFPMNLRQQELESKGERPLTALHQAMDDVLDRQRKTLAIPRRFDGNIKELWLAQPRFLMRSKAKAFRTLTHPRFRACYDFFALRAEAGDADQEVATWWEKFQFAEDDIREQMLLPDDAPNKKRKRRRKRSTGGAGGADGAGGAEKNENAVAEGNA
jgi:poly(A) polymerase